MRASWTVLALTAILAGCSGGATDEDTDAEGALIPAKAFSVDCAVKQPKDDGSVGIAHVTGRFVVAGGALAAADREPIHVIRPEGTDTTVTLKSGRVVDAERDVFEVTAKYGIFTVGVFYDGSKKDKKNVVIDMPFKPTAAYDGTCAFVDDSGASADGKVR